MNQILKFAIIASLISGLSTGSHASQEDHSTHKEQEESSHAEQGHNDKDSHGHESEEEEGVKLSSTQMNLANIKVAPLTPRTMNYQIYAPGEIKANGYTSYLVSPRIDSVVLRRHASLGDHVKKGQPLVTLFSESVAEAQATYNVTRAEWKRVQKLGRRATGEKRYITAQSNFEASYGRLLAFGLSKKAIQSLAKKPQPLGEYTLIAATEGAVLTDDFHQGQRVESGTELMVLADEKALWVEARLAPTAQLKLPTGTHAQINIGNDVFEATVTQEAHTIDPQTRTRVVRLSVDNRSHRLHPGMFADVYFSFATENPVMAVLETALMRGADGDWTVFVENEQGQYKAEEVELGRSLGKWREIQGIQPGTKVVMEGAFFVASEIAKGGFDPHGH